MDDEIADAINSKEQRAVFVKAYAEAIVDVYQKQIHKYSVGSPSGVIKADPTNHLKLKLIKQHLKRKDRVHAAQTCKKVQSVLEGCKFLPHCYESTFRIFGSSQNIKNNKHSLFLLLSVVSAMQFSLHSRSSLDMSVIKDIFDIAISS